MKAPECRFCGKIEWRHICQDSPVSVVVSRPVEVAKVPAKAARDVGPDRRRALPNIESRASRACEFCEGAFVPKRSTARFCSAKCRVYWNRKSNGGK